MMVAANEGEALRLYYECIEREQSFIQELIDKYNPENIPVFKITNWRREMEQ